MRRSRAPPTDRCQEISRVVYLASRSPLRRTTLAERPLDLVHGLMRGCFRVTVGRLILAHRTLGRHQSSNEIGSLDCVEIGLRHAPKPTADDEVATVRRHRMLQDTLNNSGLFERTRPLSHRPIFE